MSILTASPSPNNIRSSAARPNPNWAEQVKIGNGRNDTGAFHRAIAVAAELFAWRRWNGRGLLVVHDPYETHRKMNFLPEELVEGVDFDYADDTEYQGAGPEEM